jgi:hypothetical protein
MDEPDRYHIAVTVNGVEQSLAVAADETLLDVLRDRLGLTGTKRGCDRGACGTCTVLSEGRAINACLLLAPMADDTIVLDRDRLDHGLYRGDLGAGVEVYEPDRLEVELVTASGRTATSLTLSVHDLRPVADADLVSVRPCRRSA